MRSTTNVRNRIGALSGSPILALLLVLPAGCGDGAPERDDGTAAPVEAEAADTEPDEVFQGDFEQGSTEEWSEPATEAIDEPEPDGEDENENDGDETPPT